MPTSPFVGEPGRVDLDAGAAVTQQDMAREAFYDALLDDNPSELYERAPCGYLSTTPEGRIVKVNETFLTWTGYQREDVVGRRSFVQLLTPGGRLYHETHYAPMLRMQDHVREIALDLVKADNSRLPVLVNAVLEKDEAGEPRVVRIALFDATERREYERELIRARQRAEASEARASDLSRVLQQSLLPPTHPQIAGLDCATAYRPAGEGTQIGGDFYDIFQIGHDDWAVAIGDVCGKGMGAAVIAGLVRHTLRAAMVAVRSPGEALKVLNGVLLGNETERFCTASVVRLQRDPEAEGSWRATFAAGGHPPVLHVPVGKPPAELEGGGPLIGVISHARFTDTTLCLSPGDSLVLYTDGTIEAQRNHELYGEERLRACVDSNRASPSSIVQGVLAEVAVFEGGPLRDDVALVAVRVPGGDPVNTTG